MRLIYIAPVPWGSFSQRPHRFVEWFRDRFDAEVLWVNPYPTRLARPSDAWRVLNPQRAQTRSPSAWLREMTTPALPVEPLKGIRAINPLLWRTAMQAIAEFGAGQPCCICVGKPSLFAIECLQALPFAVSVYDMMDDFPAFYDGWSQLQVKRSEQEILRIASHVCFSSEALRERCARIRADGHLVPNGLDADTDWAKRVQQSSRESPVFGYLGTMASWFDWEWVARLARAQPRASVRLYGPQFGEATASLPANVQVNGPVEHARAVELMREFDVGLIPFKVNQLTAAVDPIKYYEYRALGMAVLSTPFGEMAHRQHAPGVFLSNGCEGLQSAARDALAHSSNHRLSSASDAAEFVAEHHWGKRFDALGLPQRLPQEWPLAA